MSSSPFSDHLPDGTDRTRSTTGAPPGRRDRQRLEVDGQLRGRHQPPDLLLGQRDRDEPDLRRVRREDVAERRRDDHLEAVVLERPGGVLARRAAAEVPSRDQDRRPGVLGSVQLEARILAPVVEQELAVAGALDPLQELLRDDLVGVDVGAVEHGDAGRSIRRNGLHAAATSRTSAKSARQRGRGRHRRADQVRPAARALSSLEVAVRGRRAALAGGEHVRVHAEAHRAACPPPLEVRPARTRASRPSSSAWRRTAADPGTTIARTEGCTRPPVDDRRPRRGGPRCGSSCRSR